MERKIIEKNFYYLWYFLNKVSPITQKGKIASYPIHCIEPSYSLELPFFFIGNLEIEIFTLNLNSSLEKIKDFAFTHIPFGPYCNRHLFILRSKKEEIISKYFQK